MSEIQRGDLVYVAKWPCCPGALGLYFVVDSIQPTADKENRCGYCHTKHNAPMMVAFREDGYVYPLEWLRKVKPREEPETLTEEMEC